MVHTCTWSALITASGGDRTWKWTLAWRLKEPALLPFEPDDEESLWKVKVQLQRTVKSLPVVTLAKKGASSNSPSGGSTPAAEPRSLSRGHCLGSTSALRHLRMAFLNSIHPELFSVLQISDKGNFLPMSHHQRLYKRQSLTKTKFYTKVSQKAEKEWTHAGTGESFLWLYLVIDSFETLNIQLTAHWQTFTCQMREGKGKQCKSQNIHGLYLSDLKKKD